MTGITQVISNITKGLYSIEVNKHYYIVLIINSYKSERLVIIRGVGTGKGGGSSLTINITHHRSDMS